MPQVTVELFGIPRRRAGTAEVTLVADTLADVLNQMAAKFPALHLLTPEGTLARHYLLSLDGQRFLDSGTAILPPDCRLLLLSADVGG